MINNKGAYKRYNTCFDDEENHQCCDEINNIISLLIRNFEFKF